MVSKALDIYIHDLHVDKWNSQQAPTQYQGDGSCHDLAALLVTEIIQHSLYTLKEPAYMLFLDAQSAFDRVLPELLIRNLYSAGMDGNSTIFLNNRLTSRPTYLDWDKNMMGPIEDQLGLDVFITRKTNVFTKQTLQVGQSTEELSALLEDDQVMYALGRYETKFDMSITVKFVYFRW